MGEAELRPWPSAILGAIDRVMAGTPLSANATRVMRLGAGELGKDVAIELQRLGVEVIAVDRYANAPAQQVAHRALVIDMTGRSRRNSVPHRSASACR